MKSVCSAEQMREIDRMAGELGGIPSIVLMENAAIACVNEIMKRKPKRAAVFCGKGNNGGDGFAIARHLTSRGVAVTVYTVCGGDFSGDALINFEIISKMGIPAVELSDCDMLRYYIGESDLVVDAIFGTGVHGEITGIAAEVIDAVNKYSAYTVSVDIPSGIDANTGAVCKTAVRADLTVTFAAYKTGMLMFPGADFCGELVVADISIPEYIINEGNISAWVTDPQLAYEAFPKRKANTHKGCYGKLLIVGGSVGMTGAAALAAEAALKCGAGLVTVCVPASLNEIMEVKLTEAMTLPLPEANGVLLPEAADIIISRAQTADAVLIGPGMGRSDEAAQLLRTVLPQLKIPVILDADALYALAENPEITDICSCSLILTPHEAELARLLRCEVEYVSKSRLELAKNYAADNGVTLVLKGSRTITASPDGKQYINLTGNPGMATGGSGDVLGGMLAALAARGVPDTLACAAAVWLHGRAGDLAAEKLGEESVTACDIVKFIPDALTLPVD